MPFRKTPVAARELGISYHRLIGLVRYDKITAPARDTSGDYLWADADIARAKAAISAMRHPQKEAVLA